MNIAGKEFKIEGDAGYLAAMGGTFEPAVVNLLSMLTGKDSRCLDVGANIGLTACALSVICPNGTVAAIEPVPRTFGFLRHNVQGLPTVTAFNHALGSTEGVLRMQGNPDFLAGSFVADEYDIQDGGHFTEEVPVKTIDTSFQSFGLDRLDFIKIDVEGFEIEVFEGGRQVIGDLKPLTFLEMNHWCLNVFRRMSIPEFRERLLKVFPCVYAIEGDTFVDYADDTYAHHINHAHIIGHRYNNLVAGFDRDEIISRLGSLRQTAAFEVHVEPPIDPSIALRAEIEELKASREADRATIELLKHSTSWKVTAPLRAVSGAFKK